MTPAGRLLLRAADLVNWRGKALGRPSLMLYERLSWWKREAAVRDREEKTGFWVVARKRP